MVKILGIRLSDLPDAATLQALVNEQWLVAWRERHGALREDTVVRRSLGGLYLLDRAGGYGTLSYTRRGKPFFTDSSLTFSITHTAAWVFCALCTPGVGEPSAPIGLDAESEERLDSMDLSAFASRWFTSGEQELFDADSTPHTFLRIWTGKEALVKQSGEGLSALAHADTASSLQKLGMGLTHYQVENACLALCSPAHLQVPDSVELLTLGAKCDII